MKKFIAYYRVSTKGQEISGLGLDAQQNYIHRYIENEINRSKTIKNQDGLPMCLYAEFKDIETGKSSMREGLDNAIALCRTILSKGQDAVLLIAKLDRLSRNVEFIASLKNSGIKFVACDMPDANNFTINIFAALAEQEVGMISKRTKEALDMKVKNNPNGWFNRHGEWRTKLGNPENMTLAAGIKGGLRNRYKSETSDNNIRAMNYAFMLRGIMETSQNSRKSNLPNLKNGNGNGNGGSAKENNLPKPKYSYLQIAKKLSMDGFKTENGHSFNPMQIKRLIDRKNGIEPWKPNKSV